MKFMGAHRESWGVEPICKTLQVAPSTYYAVLARQPCARQLSDQRLKIEIVRVHSANFGVYGIEKVWRQLNREGHKVGRDRVARLSVRKHRGSLLESSIRVFYEDGC